MFVIDTGIFSYTNAVDNVHCVALNQIRKMDLFYLGPFWLVYAIIFYSITRNLKKYMYVKYLSAVLMDDVIITLLQDYQKVRVVINNFLRIKYFLFSYSLF